MNAFSKKSGKKLLEENFTTPRSPRTPQRGDQITTNEEATI